MKEIVFNEENYEFKKAVKQYIKQNIIPLLKANNFIPYTANKYVREMDKIIQIVIFRVEVDRLKVFAMYYPIFVPFDYILNYGIEITGSSGVNLLGGKYFTTVYEDEMFDKKIQFQHYQEGHLDKLDKILLSLKEGIIPEFDEVDSFDKFIKKFDSEEVKFFGERFSNHFRNLPIHKYIVSVDYCLNKQFDQGIAELENLLSDNEAELSQFDNQLNQFMKKLLFAQEDKSIVTKEQFIIQLEDVYNYMRKKYKLLK